MNTTVWVGWALVAAAWLARADVLLPHVLEPSTSAVTRTEHGPARDGTAAAEQAGPRAAAPRGGQPSEPGAGGQPASLPLAPPVVPRTGTGMGPGTRPGAPYGTAPGMAAGAPSGAAAEPVPGLDLMSEAEYQKLTEPVVLRTTALWRVMGFGLWRGFANLTMWPGEIVRGFTYEFSSDREWYEAMGTSWLAGFGGGLSRMSAGMADILTLGYFGDTRLARGYPDFVWQGDWLYRETLTPPTMHTADTAVPPGPPRRIVQPGTAAATARTSTSSVRTSAPSAPPPPAARVADPTLPGGSPNTPR